MSNKARLFLGTDIYETITLTNGNFEGSLTGWTVTPSGWSYSSGYAKAQWGSIGVIKQNVGGVTVGNSYKVKFFCTFSNSSWTPNGTLQMTFGGVSFSYTEGGWKEEIITVTSGSEIAFAQSFYYIGGIDSITVEGLDSTLGWQELHLANDTFINLNFSIADIEDITKRGTTFSKSIPVPSTSNNDKILEHLYDLDVETSQKYLNKKIRALLYYDDAQILNGICEVTRVDTIHSTNQVGYEIILRSDAKTFADIISSKYITGNVVSEDDIDFSEYNHPFTVNNIMKTWSNPSFPNLPTSKYTGKGYYYPIINYADIPDEKSYNFEQLRPAIYIKEIFDKIMVDAGYTYTSTFLNTTYFKRLITPYTNKIRTSEEELDSRKFAAGLNANIVNQTGYGTPASGNQPYRYLYHGPAAAAASSDYRLPISDDSENAPLDFFDNGGYYNTSTYKYRVPNKGMYNFNFSCIARPFIYDSNVIAAGTYIAKSVNASNPTPRMEITAKIQRQRGSNITTIGSSVSVVPLNSFPFGAAYSNKFTHLKSWTTNVGSRKTQLADVTLNVNVNNMEFQEGDYIYIEVSLNNKLVRWYDALGKIVSTQAFYGTVDFFRANTDASGNPGLKFYNTPLASDNMFLGEQMDMNSCLPTKVKQIDFVNSLITMFNLIIEEDPNKQNHLIIDPRNDYFSSGTTKDWSFKLDRSQAIQIERIPSLIDKNVSFVYKEDADKYNADYQEVYEETYADWRIENEDLTSEDQEISVIFSPTPGNEIGTTKIIVPQIYQVDDNKKLVSQGYNMRILHRVDIIDAPGSTFRTNSNSSNVKIAINEYQAGKVVATGWMANTIVTASHLDDPYAPTYDLNWGYSKEYYNTVYPKTTPILPSWGNLYNEYWREYIEQLIDPNSKMITGQFNLSEQDIYNFRFYDKIKIDGQYYTVNKISDWNPDVLTTVQLIKNKVSEVPTTTVAKQADTLAVINYNNIVYKRVMQPSANRNNSTLQQQTGTGSFITSSPISRNLYNISDENNPLSPDGTWNDLSGTTAITTTVTATTFSAEPTIITPESRGYATGVNNFINSRNFFLAGNDNIFTGNTYNTVTFGDANTYEDGVIGGTIIGNENTITGGVTGSTIIGNGITVTKSDTLVLGNKTILSKVVIEPIVDIIAAPNLDGDQINPFNRLKQIQVLSGGDIAQGVRPLRSANTTFVVDSRTTPTTSYSSYAEEILDADGNPIV